MKSIPQFAITLLIATMMLAAFPTDAEAQIYDDTIRLHILANSDSSEDQGLKIAVRDRLLTEYGEQLRQGGSYEEAEMMINNVLPEIEESVEEWIKEFGFDYDARATITVEWYETREYEGFTLPAGYYTSLRIIIGEGEGQNWWCVMYPPMCMGIACESEPADDGVIDYTKEEITLIKSGKYNVKFKILEELSRAFAKSG
ncbi:MAG: stage II sporulation protein R [Ruminococcaceae bacterium]|nr:stage II sporulation protein R [Oscillospiraceae bacterium]